MRLLTLIPSIALSFLFVSCDKNECKHKNIKQVSLTYEKPLYKGFPLLLNAEAGSNYYYRFRGPNNLDLNNSNNFSYYKHVSTSEDEGFYAVQISNNDCVIGEGKVNVVFDTPPAPPCSVANNSSTTNLIGIGGVNYGYISYSNMSYPTLTGSANDQSLTFRFAHEFTPLPGVYTSVDGNPQKNNEVLVYITKNQIFYMYSGYKIYINEVNGELHVSFCSANFTNPIGSSTITISAKLARP